MKTLSMILCVLLTPSLRAQSEEGVSFGASVHLGTLLQGDGPHTGNSASNRVGSGVEGFVAARWNRFTETRLGLGFTGIRAGSWAAEDGTATGGEYWRSLRFGGEQVFNLRAGAGGYPYVFGGGGIQETWVARTEGNLSGATFAALFSVFTNANVSYSYREYTDALDSWSGYGTAGLGWHFDGPAFIEVRTIVGDHLEYVDSGLSASAREAKVYRRGVQCLLSAGVQF